MTLMRSPLVLLALTLATSATFTSAGKPRHTAAKPVHHYVFFGQDREKLSQSASFLESKAFDGAQVTYSWKQLEPARDEYDFSMIRADLKLLKANGKKLWIQFQDVTFSPNRVNVPKYLQNDPKFNGGADKQYRIKGDDEAESVHEGWMARRWDPAVQERLHKMFFALGKEFDGQIEGINLDETSGGFGWTGRLWPKGYTHEIYRDAIITNMKALRRAFPKSVAMQYANFMPGGKRNLDAIYKAAQENKVALGGPDLLPFRPFQRANSYPLIRKSAGVVKTGIAVQDGNYADVNQETGKRADIAELLEFATGYLKVDYIFWCTEEPYYSNELIPFMQANPSSMKVK